MWRRWTRFCESLDIVDPFLDDLSEDEREVLLRAFLECYRVSKFAHDGSVSGRSKKPLVGKTLRGAASSLAAAFRYNFKFSPLHVKGSDKLLPSIRALLRAIDHISPPEKRQKAITPKLLRKLWKLSSLKGTDANIHDHAIDLIIGAFFFAMRPCEYVSTGQPGKTKILRLRTIQFRCRKKRVIAHTDSRLLRKARFVSVTFEDQKNGDKMDVRTQR